MDEQDEMDGWAQLENEERHRREDEALARARVMADELRRASEDFERACEHFRNFMIDYERTRYESWRS